MNNIGFSIIICCYNSALRLPDTLKAVSRLNASYFSYEVLIIDNCSEDNTTEVATEIWKNCNSDKNLRVIYEDKLGLSYARERGISEASFGYVLFCDDDNWLMPDYLNNAFQIMTNHSDVGILGGYGIPVPEIEPPYWFEKVQSAYAVGKKNDPEGYLNKRESFIAGAGMVLKKDIISKIKSCGFNSLLSDRKGNNLSSAGDLEFSYVVKLAGYKLYYSEKLVFYHFIPKERLKWNYIIRGCKGYGKAVNVIDAYLYVLRENILYKSDIKNNFNLGVVVNILIAFIRSFFSYLPELIKRKKHTHEEINFRIRIHQLLTSIQYFFKGNKTLPYLIDLKIKLMQL